MIRLHGARRFAIAIAIAAAAIVAVPLFGAAQVASASPALPRPFASGEMLGVACLPGTCVAAGAAEILQPQAPQAWMLSKGVWRVSTLSNGTAHHRWLTNVSCPQVGDCVGVGDTDAGTPFAARLSGGTWQDLALPAGTLPVQSISCPTTTWCMAIADSQSTFEVLVWSGTTWTQLQPAVSTSPWSLDAVTCLSTTSCVVGGYSESTPLLESWDGTAWTITTPPPQSRTESYANVVSISCTSTAFCIAVGWTYGCCGSFGSVAMSWDGTTWTSLPMSTNLSGAILDGVSCTSPTSCLAVGVVTPADVQTFKPYAVVGRWDGSSLAQVGGATAGIQSMLGAVSCTRASWCAAVGSYTTRRGLVLPLVERWNGAGLNRMYASG